MEKIANILKHIKFNSMYYQISISYQINSPLSMSFMPEYNEMITMLYAITMQ